MGMIREIFEKWCQAKLFINIASTFLGWSWLFKTSIQCSFWQHLFFFFAITLFVLFSFQTSCQFLGVFGGLSCLQDILWVKICRIFQYHIPWKASFAILKRLRNSVPYIHLLLKLFQESYFYIVVGYISLSNSYFASFRWPNIHSVFSELRLVLSSRFHVFLYYLLHQWHCIYFLRLQLKLSHVHVSYCQ